MMNDNWAGFYGPGYRALLECRNLDAVPATCWEKILCLHEENPVQEKHWEFLAVAYLHLFDHGLILHPAVSEQIFSIYCKFSKKHKATNWRLMGVITHCRINSKTPTKAAYNKAGLIQNSDGFLQDIPGDESSQYHAFILFLVMRFFNPEDLTIHASVHRAFNWLIRIYRQYGNPSPLGRGRFQIFGYASMAAIAGLAKRWSLRVPSDWEAAVWSELRYDEGSGALSSKWDGPHRSLLLHGYNTADDYPAFAELLTYGLPKKDQPPKPSDGSIWWNELDRFGSGILSTRNGPLLSIQIMESNENAISIKQALVNLISDRASGNSRPILVPTDFIFPKNFIRFNLSHSHLTLDWGMNRHQASFASFSIWSRLPIIDCVWSGSTETTQTKWHRKNCQSWDGRTFYTSRFGRCRMIVKI